jgi:predicted HTH transcriptional regulator
MKNRIISKIDLDLTFKKLHTTPSDELENEQLEFKCYDNSDSLFNSKNLAETVCAFSNNKGGAIVIGVVDSSNIVDNNWYKQLRGFQLSNLAELKNRLCGKLDPPLDLNIESVYFEQKEYIVIHIPQELNQLVATKSGKMFIRDGKQSRPMSPVEIEQHVKSLQSYDWSNELIDVDILESLDLIALNEARLDYCNRRKIQLDDISELKFLESIGATKNGKLLKGGLIFLGTKDIIEKQLGSFEYRFSRKTRGGHLRANEIWTANIWFSLKKVKELFSQFNNNIELEFRGENYKAPMLDEIAFHEAFLNSVVHRDYSIDGMISINFTDDNLILTNPGNFYGGVTANNIAIHEPRHRNKALANILMLFHLVDRAGMGVFRMGARSLMYGRSFPKFEERSDSISVSMDTEYIHAEVFVVAVGNINEFGLTELLMLNLINQNGYISITELESKLEKITKNPWEVIQESFNKTKIKNYFVLEGSNKGIFITPNNIYKDYFKSKRYFKPASNSDKHVLIYRHLKENIEDSNENLKNILGFKHASSMSNFLKKAAYLRSKGTGKNRRWSLRV